MALCKFELAVATAAGIVGVIVWARTTCGPARPSAARMRTATSHRGAPALQLPDRCRPTGLRARAAATAVVVDECVRISPPLDPTHTNGRAAIVSLEGG